MLQITDFGLNVLCEPDSSDPIDDERNYQRKLIIIYQPLKFHMQLHSLFLLTQKTEEKCCKMISFIYRQTFR